MNFFSVSAIITFTSLVLAQTLLFNHFYIFGFVNPIVYLLFFVYYRFESNQTLLIGLAFLLGFFVDFISQSGGAHTIASLTVGFLRPILIRYAFGATMDSPQSYFTDSRRINKLIFLVLMVLLHHTFYFTLVYFSWDAFYLILRNTFITSIFSLILMGIALSFYSNKK